MILPDLSEDIVVGAALRREGTQGLDNDPTVIECLDPLSANRLVVLERQGVLRAGDPFLDSGRQFSIGQLVTFVACFYDSRALAHVKAQLVAYGRKTIRAVTDGCPHRLGNIEVQELGALAD